MSNAFKKFATVALLVAGVLMIGASVPAANAATAAELQAQLAALQAQLAALQGSSTACTFTRSLTVGSRGADVTCLQDYLKSTGHLGASVSSTGYFGSLTRAAVARWQAANAVAPAAGYFGALSRAKYTALVSVVVTPAPTTPGATPTPVPATGFSVALAGPVSSTLVSGTTDGQSQGMAPLANFTFSGNGTVTSIALKRIGVSADTTLDNVYLFDGDVRLTDAATVATGGVITFNGLNWTVAGTRTLSVRADINTGTQGQTIGVQLTGATVSSGSVAGLPVSGNLHTIASADLATLALGAATTLGNSDAANGVTVWDSTATVGTRDVLMTRLSLRQIGSIASADIRNFKLYVDGVLTATVAGVDATGFVTFSMSKALATGTRLLKVTADLVGGSGRTVQLSLRGAYDISATDTQYNVGVRPTATFPVGSATFTVNSGSMTTVKATTSRSTNATVGASDQSLATYTLTAFGEAVKVETLRVGIVTNGTPSAVTLRNVRIMVNGAQVGSTTNVPADVIGNFTANTGTQFTTNFTVVPGSPATVEVRGDLVDVESTDDIAAGTVTTVQAVLVAATSNAVPQVSLGTLNVPHATTNVLGNVITVASGSITVAKTTTFGDQTIVVPKTAQKIGSFVLTGNATEAVNINTIYVGFADPSGSTDGAPATDLTDLYVVYGNNQTTVKGTVTCVLSSGVCENANSWSVNFTLGVNQTMQIDVFATVASTLSTNKIQPTLAVAGVTANSGITVYADASGSTTLTAGVAGQTITGGVGAIAASLDASTPASAIVDDSGTVTTLAARFAAANDAYTVTDLTVTVSNASAVSTVTLWQCNSAGASCTEVTGGSRPGATSITFSSLSIPVAANGATVVKVVLTLNTVGVGAGTTGSALTTAITAATARNTAGTSSTPTGLTVTGNPFYVYKAIPTITVVNLPTSTLTGGGTVNTLSKFTVSSGGTGTISWNRLKFTVTKGVAAAGGDTLTSIELRDADTNTVIAGTAVCLDGVCAADDDAGSIVFIADAEQSISGAKTYELRATVGGTIATNDFVTTALAQPSSFATSLAALAAQTASGINYWDADDSDTVTANDVRKTAGMLNYTSAYAQTNGGVVTFLTSDNTDENRSYGSFTTGATIILTETGAATNTISAITGTLVSTDLFTCTARDAANGGGSATTSTAAILSILCTKTGSQIVLNTAYPGANVAAESTTITLTVGTAFTINSVVGANDSDLGLALVDSVAAAASFVWSDNSAASHTVLTTDWTNDYLVRNLPITQSLIR